jgi:hypothetical protein
MTELTANGAERTAFLAHVTCASTLSWAVGSALGGLLSTVHAQLPELVAVLLYAANALLILGGVPPSTRREPHTQPDSAVSGPKPPALVRAASNFSFVLHNRTALRVLSVQLARVLIIKALGSASDLYELERWSLSTVEMGLLRSYKSVAVLGVQVLFLPLLLSRQFGLHSLLHAFTTAKVLIDLIEFVPSHALGGLSALPFLPTKLAEDPSLLIYAAICIPVRARRPVLLADARARAARRARREAYTVLASAVALDTSLPTFPSVVRRAPPAPARSPSRQSRSSR